MKLASAPTGSIVYWVDCTPCWSARYWVRKLVDEPRPVTPSVLPFASAIDLKVGAALVDTISTSPGTWQSTAIAFTSLPLLCRSTVWS